MKKTILRLGKILSTFVLAALVVFADTRSVDAAASSIKVGTVKMLPGYIAGTKFHIKPLVGGGYAYCLNMHKKTASNVTEYYYRDMNAGYAYIIENGYPNKSFTGNKNKDFYITQAAIWWYLDDISGSSNLSKSFKTTGSDKYGLRKYVKKLVNGAHQAKKTGYKSPSLNAKISTTTMTLDGKYYVSKAVDANAKNITGKYKVSVTNAPSGTIITDVKGNKQSSFKANEKFLIKIPASKVKEGTTEKATVKITASSTINKAYKYTPKDNSVQPMVILQPYTKTVTDTIKVKATKAKVEKHICEYDKTANKYYGKNGTVVSKEQYIKECTTPKACSYNEEFNVYFGKDGSIVTKAEYEDQCLEKKTCEYDKTQDKYFGKDGSVVTKAEYEDQCLEKKYCEYDKDQNKYFGKNGTEVTKQVYLDECDQSKVTINKLDKNTNNTIAGATLVIKDANGNKIKEFTSTTTGYVLTGLSNGTYTVEEVAAPKGYEVSDEKVKFEITDTERNIEVKFYNIPKERTVIINKIDSVTGKAVVGAVITVTNEAGEEVARFTTTNEAYILNDLEDGTYKVEEEEAPEGYFINEEVQTFTLDSTHKSFEITIKDVPRTCDNGGKDADECSVEVPNTGSSSLPFYLIGIAITSAGAGYVYKKNKAYQK